MKISSFPGQNWHSKWDDKSARRVRLDRFGCRSSQLRGGGVSVFTLCVRLFLRICISGSHGRNRGKHWSWIRSEIRWHGQNGEEWRPDARRPPQRKASAAARWMEKTLTNRSCLCMTTNGGGKEQSTKYKSQDSPFPPLNAEKSIFLKMRSKVRIIVNTHK